MESITRTLAVELAPIRVNAFAPGIVRTALWHGIPEADREAMFEATAQQLPVGRIGTPEDVALTVVYLMADGYVTGTVAELNGGNNLV
jgi:NAD(P)-dependent dehydrogenase (short-subunit alcohol dehydrogenase family)